MHAVLKCYFEPYSDNHEIKIGSYVADIVGENGVIEIQTKSFDRLRKKLIAFLEVTRVTIVYPIPKTKWLYWIDQETGLVSEKRKSPKSGTPFEIFFELYKIKDLLQNENLRFCITMIDIEEYRSLNGFSKDKKKGSTRFERIPIDIIDEIYIDSICDYSKLMPIGLPDKFTAKELSHATKTSPRVTQCGISVLRDLGVIQQIGKLGRAYLYEKA